MTRTKSCAVTIRPACTRLSETSKVTIQDYNTRDVIVNFDGISMDKELCFNLTARNDTKTVVVEGKYSGKTNIMNNKYP